MQDASDLSKAGRRNRRKGAEIEREIVGLLRDAGIPAEKISRTGHVGPDIMIADEFVCESKFRQSGFAFTKWLEGVTFLFLREPRKEPYVVMRLSMFVKLMKWCRGE